MVEKPGSRQRLWSRRVPQHLVVEWFHRGCRSVRTSMSVYRMKSSSFPFSQSARYDTQIPVSPHFLLNPIHDQVAANGQNLCGVHNLTAVKDCLEFACPPQIPYHLISFDLTSNSRLFSCQRGCIEFSCEADESWLVEIALHY